MNEETCRRDMSGVPLPSGADAAAHAPRFYMPHMFSGGITGISSYANMLNVDGSHLLGIGEPVNELNLICRYSEMVVGLLGGYNAWIALLDGNKIGLVASSFSDGFRPLQKQMEQGIRPYCLSQALHAPGVVVIAEPHTTCGNCKLAGHYKGRVGISCRIEYAERVYGAMTISVPEHMLEDVRVHDQLKMAAKELGQMLAQSRLVDQQSRLAELLRKSEALLEATQAMAKIGGWEWSIERSHMHWTSEIYRIFDVGETDLSSDSDRRMQTALSCYSPHDRDELMMRFNRCLELGEPYDLTYLVTVASGKQKWLRTIGKPILAEGVITGAYGNLQDITEQKETEKELSESRRQLFSLMDNLPGMVYQCRCDEHWTMVFVSRGFREITGYEPADIIDNHRMSYASLIHPDDRDGVARAIHEARETNKLFTMEYRITNARGEERWVWERGHTVSGADDGEVRIEGFITDITERRQLEQHVTQMQRHESLSLLAAGVAHDFNNLLMAIVGNTELANSATGPGHPANEYLKQIVKSAQQAGMLCQQMLSFSGKGSLVTEPVHLGRFVESMLPMLLKIVPGQCRLELDPYAKDLPEILADPAEIRQVVTQLVINAWESYHDQEGMVRIAVGCEDVKDRQQRLNPSDVTTIPMGQYVWLTVSDQGCGMTPGSMKLIYDPFYTTKFTGRGMGLPAVKGIVNALKGHIMVSSKPQKGSIFKVLLPAAIKRSLVDPSVEKPAPVTARTPAQCVLFVDDDPVLRQLGERMLQHAGCRVITANDGRAAVDIFREHAAELDLVITDLTMPRLDGIEAAKLMQQMKPSIRIVLTTGYSENEISSRIDTSRLAGVLLKPFRRDDLLKLLQT